MATKRGKRNPSPQHRALIEEHQDLPGDECIRRYVRDLARRGFKPYSPPPAWVFRQPQEEPRAAR